MTAFPSIRTEGGLLGSDLLDQLRAADLPGQKPADFGLEARRSLTDEIAALFADARALWGVFQNRRARLREGAPAVGVTRDWVIPFLGLLGYELRENPRPHEVDGLSFHISDRAGDADDAPPVHIVGAGQDLGKLATSGRPRRAPHSLVQEYLNRTEHVWGLVTNGLILRLLRDSTFIRRQAYVEFDLQALLDEQRFEDFVVLYRLLHRSRLPRGQADAGDCLLEKYRAHAEEQGGRVREHLREGVEKCITLLANGFLRANEDLSQRVSRSWTGNDRVAADALYRQLLRLVYRFLFLLVSEDRGLLSADPLYREHYGIGRLRRLLEQRAAFSDHDDLWQSLRVLWQVLAEERFAPYLGLVALNGELFTPQDLDQYTLSNRDLLEAFWHLAWYQERSSNPRRVNYSALDVEELGSVYESLLEFHPALDEETSGRPVFQLLVGSERKTTGSYYTPPQLVVELIKSALEPVLAVRLAARPKDPEKAILLIRVCDPACGSGHFLLAAARRLGKELARVRSGDEEPAPERVREAVRDVISHCIYGVDKNPLAVDLCRVALWLESHTGDKPLTFLDHRIRPGDSLVGVFDLATLANGVPDEAFKPLEGDDKATARALEKRNRQEKGGQNLEIFASSPDSKTADLTRHSRDLDAIADDSPEAIRRKKHLFEKSHQDPSWQKQQEACDLWTAAFFQPLEPGALAITSGDLADYLAGRAIDARLKALAFDLSTGQRFFHWPLEFPVVFAEGGFDVILSNPPWERVKLQEQEFFAARDARIVAAPTKAARSRLIRELPDTNSELYNQFVEALRAASATSSILRHGGRYPFTGRGDINTYAVFAELCRELLNSTGQAGVVLPSGIALSETTRFFFEDLIQKGSLVSLLGFFEIRKMFTATDSRDPFCLFTLAGAGSKVESAEYVFDAKEVSDIHNAEKRFTLSPQEIELLNPNTRTCPVFRSRRDAVLTKAIYRRVPVLWQETAKERPECNPWGISFKTLFHMSNDSHYFRTQNELQADGYLLEGNIYSSAYGRYLPLYEAKMVHQFNHRWATYDNPHDSREVTREERSNPFFVVQPRYWVREEIVDSVAPNERSGTSGEEGDLREFKWFLGWRDICRSTDERTLISSVLPIAAVGNNLPLMFIHSVSGPWRLAFAAMLNSFIVDYVARQKVSGTHINFFYLKQFPLLPPESLARGIFPCDDFISHWLAPRALELAYSAVDLSMLAQDQGYEGLPFAWSEDRRFEIRCELDAAFFHLYLPSEPSGIWRRADAESADQLAELAHHFQTPRDAVAFILDQFKLVRQKEEIAHGRYRTQERILDIYDTMLDAQRTTQSFRTNLIPPPGKW